MTASEAIKIIKNYDIYGCGYCHQGGDEVEKAFDIAIKALEQEPCGKDIYVPATDAISRQVVNTLVDELARAISDERCFISRGRSTATIMQDILDLPSVTPARARGKWMTEHNKGYVQCSNCHKRVPFCKRSNFCPNCGTDMRGDINAYSD